MIAFTTLLSALLALGQAAPVAASATQTGAWSPPQPGLRDLAKRRRLDIGTAIPADALMSDADGGKYAATAAATFNLMELENDLKPPAVWTGSREYNFKNVDFVLGEPGREGWAQKHKMKLRGHVLVYARDEGYTLPQWLRSNGTTLSKDEATQLLHDYILAVAGRYRGKVAMWDVANEAIDDRPNQNPFNLRNSFWFRKLGPDFLVLAFKWAHEADPKAELYYNDYGIEGGGPKAQHVLDLAKWLKQQGAPITGVGLQYHLGLWAKIAPGDNYHQFIDQIRQVGLAYMITELDIGIPVQPLPFSDPNRGVLPQKPEDLDAQAKLYAAVFQMALSSGNCHGVNIWGLTDGHSWIPGYSGGREGAATLFDKDYNPKPAYRAVVAVLKG